MMPARSNWRESLTALMPASVELKFHSIGEYENTAFAIKEFIGERTLDGMIYSGAPVDHLGPGEIDFLDAFESAVRYHEDVPRVFLCWAAMAQNFLTSGEPWEISTEKRFYVRNERFTSRWGIIRSVAKSNWTDQTRWGVGEDTYCLDHVDYTSKMFAAEAIRGGSTSLPHGYHTRLAAQSANREFWSDWVMHWL